MIICKDRLEKLDLATKAAPEASAKARDVNSAVESEITQLLQGKTHEQLVQLQRQIQAKLGSGEPIDVDYWEGLLKSLLVWKARVSSDPQTRTFCTYCQLIWCDNFSGHTQEYARSSCDESPGATTKKTAR